MWEAYRKVNELLTVLGRRYLRHSFAFVVIEDVEGFAVLVKVKCTKTSGKSHTATAASGSRGGRGFIRRKSISRRRDSAWAGLWRNMAMSIRRLYNG